YANAEFHVNNRTELNITLQPQENGLEQVVVIGYGERKKKDVTGAVSTVTSKDIEKSTSMTPELALQGKAAGVFIESGGGEPQARPTIRIRGVNTFGFAEPLYVIDGVPIFEGGAGVTGGAIGDIRSPINIFSLINPNDIESISVLKDASAAAIYGVRASNGVILITTKKGKTGKPKVEVVTTYGIQNIPKTKDVLNTQQYFDLVQEGYNNNPDMDNGVIVPIGNKFGALYDPASAQYAGNSPTYDWQKELLNKDASIQDYSVRVSGGNENTTYYFSGGYSKTESLLKSNFLERYSVAMNVDSKISKYVQAGLNVRLIQENSLVNTQADLGTMMSTIPFQPFYDKNDPTGFAPVVAGTFVPNPDYDPNLLNAGAPFIFDGEPHFLWGPQTRFNVFAFQALNNNKYQLLHALGNAFIQIEPITGLKIKGTLGGAFYFNLRKSWSNHDEWRFNQTPDNPYSGQDGNSKGTYGERQGRTHNLDKELTINYNHTFYKEHNIDIILNASYQFGRWYVTDLSGQVNYADPQYRGISNQPPYTSGFAGILQEDALIGYLGRISYKFKDKYYLDATLRYDGSSELAPGHKWDKFPSFAAAWRISAENFFQKTNFINDLKLRGGYGKLGNYQSLSSPYKY
ncbi:MAG TPA: SusC/RagA family TonB-linked outer membrane protein, partial [Chitinophagaceae bacterium]|nr:SusC/RagA family TonB-linked outer membrane protein [Chitinophagaceae bacterium]